MGELERDRWSVVDGLVAGLVTAFFALTVVAFWDGLIHEHGRGWSISCGRDASPGREVHLEVDDPDENVHIGFRLPVSLVERVAEFAGNDASSCFEAEMREADLDLLRIWRGVRDTPSGEDFAEVHGRREISARRDGEFVEIRITERSDSEDRLSSPGRTDAEEGLEARDREADSSGGPEVGRAHRPDDDPSDRDVASPWAREKIVVRLPVRLLDGLVDDAGRSKLSLAAIVRECGRAGNVDLLTVESGRKRVRISLEGAR